MLISLAWKNIWRNKKRSGIIIAAITFGLWGGLFSSALMVGMMENMVETAISRDLSHIQIHKQDYDQDQDVRSFIPNGPTVLEQTRQNAGVESAEGRTVIMGMAASPTSSFGIRIVGLIPEDSRQVTDIHTQVMEGSFFDSQRRNPILIGRKLAERLNLKIRSKVVLSFQDLEGNIVYMACRVIGIFKTNSTQFDEMNAYVKQGDLYRVLESEPIIHEIAIRAVTIETIEQIKMELQQAFPTLQIESWTDLAPELAYLSTSTNLYMYIFVGIILFALLFGITNTMLMSVVDRIRELGVLIAIGMKKGRIFFMILLETILLSLTGGLFGTIIGVLTIAYFGRAGIDLTFVSTGLESWGMAAVLYPFLPAAMYIVLTIMILIAANIAALLPAWKATHLVPSEAIRTY
ncbi:MAG: ABC transporter permease [Calditrichia bacterium]|nr:ABC transporter permease [Calditrichia bacterium]